MDRAEAKVMDRREAIQELTQWRDQMKSHGVPNYGKKLTALDLAIQALKLRDKYVKALERMIEGAKEINKFLEEATTPKEMTLEEWQEIDRAIQGDAESATTTDCIRRADTIKAICAECLCKDYCQVDCTEVAIVRGMPPVNQKQITGKLESAEIATSEGKESAMGQPKSKLKNPCDSLLKADSDEGKEQKSKLDCISRQQAIEALDRIGSVDTEADREYARDIFDNLPPVTPTERTGEWVEVDSWNSERHAITDMRCSECNKYATLVLPLDTTCTYPYCPNCGAKMGE